MTESTVQHATIVLERNYGAAPARVFAAFADAAERAQWHVPATIGKSPNTNMIFASAAA